MIFYSHSKINETGISIGSKKLQNHIDGVLAKAKTVHELNINFEIKPDLFAKMLDTIVRFHDFGKYTSYFQNYLLKKGVVNGILKQHARVGGIVAYNMLDNEDRKIALITLFIIFRHHTQLCDILQFPKVFNNDLQYVFEAQKADVLKNKMQIEHELGITGLDSFLNYPNEREVRRAFKFWIRKDANIKDYFLINYLFSLLIESDKLDASDTRQYKLQSINQNSVDDRFGKPNLKVSELSSLSNNEIRNLCRAEVVSNIEREDILKYKIFTLTAPTGIGKTMTALDFALKLKRKIKDETGCESRIIYALPFINIIEQALNEYELTLPPQTKIIGHYQYADIFGETVTRNENIDVEQNYNQKKMLVDTWQGDVVITSFVQFFETLIGHRNKLLKKFNHFSNSIVILDEVQTLRLDQMPLIGATLYFVSKFLNTRVILMTATKPKIFELAQQEILKNEGETVEPMELLKPHREIFALFKRTRIVPLLDVKFCDDIVSEFIEKIFQDKWNPSKSCLIVCNTVNRSISVHNQITEYLQEQEIDNSIHYLSTNIIPAHRAERIKRIRQEISDGNTPILISTQVVEAGVDLDFDMGFRDLGPIDSIIQVAGRINRNNSLDKTHSPLYVVDFGDAKKIYGLITASQSEKALMLKREFLEEEYFSLIDSYFDNISSRSSFSRFNKIFQSMKLLRYDSDDWNTDRPVSSFRIIEESQNTVAVYIEFDIYSKQLRENYLKKITGEISKEFFDENFKTPFQQNIISVPKYLATGLKSINEFDESLLVVDNEVLHSYYDENTGFIRQQTEHAYML